MSKITLSVAPVEFSAQGVTETFNLADAAPVAIEGIIAYGIRRWVQDYVNSQAHAFKLAAKEAADKGEAFNDGKPFDAAACIAQRLEQARTGEIRARGESGPAFTPEQDAAYEIIAHADTRKAVTTLAKAWSSCKGMTSPERKAAMLAALDAMPQAFRDHVATKAADAIATRTSLAALLA